MKLKLLLVITCFAVLLNSCKKGDSNTVEDGFEGISYKENGVSRVRTSCSAVLGTDSKNVPKLTITHFVGGDVWDIVFNPSVGSKKLGESAYVSFATYSGVYEAYNGGAIPFSIMITSLTSAKVSGTFQYSVNRDTYPLSTDKLITEGKFGCKVTKN